MADEIGLFEAIHTSRSSRRIEGRPVPDEAVRRVLDAARHATSPTNAQPWKFVVVRDDKRRKAIGEIYLRAWEVAKPFYGDPEKAGDDAERRMLVATDTLAQRFGEVPCMIVCCLDRTRLGPLVTPDLQTLLDPASAYGSVWASVQIILLAARGLGLTAVPTTLTRLFEADVKSLLGLPDGVETVCVLALGYSKAKPGTPARLALSDVAFGERWSEPLA